MLCGTVHRKVKSVPTQKLIILFSPKFKSDQKALKHQINTLKKFQTKKLLNLNVFFFFFFFQKIKCSEYTETLKTAKKFLKNFFWDRSQKNDFFGPSSFC